VIEGRISTTTVQMPTTRKTDRQPAAFRSRPGFAAYTTSKAAVAMLTRQAALGYADDGIRVNAVTPGLIDTPLLGDLTPAIRAQAAARTPPGRLGAPQTRWMVSSREHEE
jgi:NAD(P)-dependent dehydrogenase (short-subunit alcohol dehydrogenase family)